MDLNNLFKNVNLSNVILALATVLGAWGGFPDPPQFFKDLTKYQLFKYYLVFVLLYQGGAGQDITLALLITVVFYIVTKVSDEAYELLKKHLKKHLKNI